MRNPIAFALVLASFVASTVLVCGCEALKPPTKPKPPTPGAFVSTPFPDVQSLNDIIVLKPGLAYAVGTAGTILKMVDDNVNGDKKDEPVCEKNDDCPGSQLCSFENSTGDFKEGVCAGPNPIWTKEESGTTEDLQSIAGFLKNRDTEQESEVLLVVGFNGTVLQRTAPGEWTPASSNAGATCPLGDNDCSPTERCNEAGTCVGVALFSVDVRNETDAFIVGDFGRIIRVDSTAGTTTPGVPGTLTTQAQQTTQTVVGGTCAVNADCGLNSVCRSTDPDGAGPAPAASLCNTFFPIPEPLAGVSGDGTVIAVGARGAVYSYDAGNCTATTPCDDAARTCCWNREDSGTTRTLASVFTRSGTFIPTTDGVLLVRSGDVPPVYDDESVRTPAPVFLQDVWVEGDIYAVGLSQEIFHRDGGGQWLLTTVADDAEMRGIDGFDAPPDTDGAGGQKFFAVGGGGRIVRGPSVLPVKGESALTVRAADSDFLTP